MDIACFWKKLGEFVHHSTVSRRIREESHARGWETYRHIREDQGRTYNPSTEEAYIARMLEGIGGGRCPWKE